MVTPVLVQMFFVLSIVGVIVAAAILWDDMRKERDRLYLVMGAVLAVFLSRVLCECVVVVFPG